MTGRIWMLVFAMIATAAMAQDTPASPPTQPQAQQPSQPQPPPDAQTQQPSPSQPPADAQQPSSSQASQEPDINLGKKRKAKVRDYDKWQFNVGGGAGLYGGTTHTYVRGGGGVASAGVARNASKFLGLRAEGWWEDLPLRQSALGLAQAQSATSGLWGISLGPVVNVPVTEKWGGYLIVGPGFYHRYGTLNSTTVPPGSSCAGFFSWWTYCPTSLPSGFANTSQNQFGLNLGGGITHKIGKKLELYVDLRYQHSSHNKVTTDVKPITIGVRW